MNALCYLSLWQMEIKAWGDFLHIFIFISRGEPRSGGHPFWPPKASSDWPATAAGPEPRLWPQLLPVLPGRPLEDEARCQVRWPARCSHNTQQGLDCLTTHFRCKHMTVRLKIQLCLPQSVPSRQWACPGGSHQPTRGPVLHRQLPGWLFRREGWGEVWKTQLVLSGDTELARCRQPGRFIITDAVQE